MLSSNELTVKAEILKLTRIVKKYFVKTNSDLNQFYDENWSQEIKQIWLKTTQARAHAIQKYVMYVIDTNNDSKKRFRPVGGTVSSVVKKLSSTEAKMFQKFKPVVKISPNGKAMTSSEIKVLTKLTNLSQAQLLGQ